MKYGLLILLSIFTTSNATVIEAFDVVKYVKSFNHKTSYEIKATRYYYNQLALKNEFNYFNRKKLFEKYFFFQKGNLKINNKTYYFDKSFYLDNKIILKKPYFYNNGKKITSNECSLNIKKNIFYCKRIKELKNNKIISSKINYKVII